MFDREFYAAEELDSYVEIHQAGQVAKFLPDVPADDLHLADKLMGICAIAQPDVKFLADVEKQIHERARKLPENTAESNRFVTANH